MVAAERAVIFLFIIVGFALYANALQGQMLWDDENGILNNRYIQDWSYLPSYFSENLIAGAGMVSNLWRPLLLLIFSLEWHLWGDWVVGYHAVNIAFHIADAILLFFLLRFIFRKHWLALLTALIFLIHPLQTEAVTYISGLADPLSVFFVLSGLLFYLRAFYASTDAISRNKFYAFSVASYVLGLMSKETAIIFPALIAIADFFTSLARAEQLPVKELLLRTAKRAAPFFVIAAGYIALRATALNFQNTFNFYKDGGLFASSIYLRILTFFKVLTVYFGLLVAPLGLHMERTVEIATTFFTPSVVAGGLLFTGMLAVAFTQYRRLPVVSFGILWFLIGLAPTSNIFVPINALLYEHWLYLPLVGIFLALIWGGMEIAKRYNLRLPLLGILIVFSLFLAVRTIDRNRDWKDAPTFYRETLKYTPNNYRLLLNLGVIYASEQNYRGAEELYVRAIEVELLNPAAHHNLARLLQLTGRKDAAIEHYRKAIILNPRAPISYGGLANLHIENKQFEEARALLEEYLNYDPLKTGTLAALAKIAFENERNPRLALDYLNRALAIDPRNEALQTAVGQVERLVAPR